MEVYTVTGKQLALREPAVSSGGEGAIYEIKGYPDRLVKIYHDIGDARKREAKIAEMIKISRTSGFCSANIARDIAWPRSPIYDKGRRFIGFGMNRIAAATELDDLYAYPPKKNAGVTIRWKINCLISLCDVIERLHRTGQVFGDFNPNNIKVRSDGTMGFVDADSYHIISGGREYRCVVCAPGYVAPELLKACKGTTYADCSKPTFTRETDYFALAIHCFRMLMNGCHPFICERHLKKAGSAPAARPTDKRVEYGETPFFKKIPNYTTPHYAPDINSFPPYIRDLFRRAFVDGHSNPGARPTAGQWKQALLRFSGELKSCAANPAHDYWRQEAKCPYCEADKRHAAKALPASAASHSGGPAVYTARKTAAAAAQSPKIRFNASTVWFWAATVIGTLAMLVYLKENILPQIYYALFENQSLVSVGVYGSMISGLAGSIVYNGWWTPGRRAGCYDWWEYLVSPLTAVGFVCGFGLAMCAVLIVLYLFAAFLAVALVVGAVAAMLTGG
ncbi:MAG: hypothetical protein LUH04_12020 [Clostridium sp.]|nr:hypothetical protein [Clostridium sp.]